MLLDYQPSQCDVCVCVAALQSQNQHFQHKPDVGLTHAFNQWQACLKDSLHLNQLLGFPLPEPQVAR